ncbi:malonate transporter subunit MadL [Xanthobacter oligotrophicus]|uniref:malonate transporter subunit MadL n=1 Tax=Xanthobacter oligotrophicus TaxID=2607286 RepID=UPI0011F14E2F|nr:malonate transporter subunit MadL [Xanthobacter oligotrophicus]MCG5236556.1 malonate transporter subunit MadL [Xanthobacter oligotrophicus]
MVIFGTALLAACYLAGIWVGEAIAVLIGVKANVGGVGIAMIFLIAAQHFLKKKGLFPAETEKGVVFWAMMYIPVVVAMAATQNVVVAIKGGPIALLSAVGSFLLCFGVVALINRSMQRNAPPDEADAAAGLVAAPEALKSR